MPQGHPLTDRFGSEGGEQRGEHRPRLERPEERGVQIRLTAGQTAHEVARSDPQAAQDFGEPRRPLSQLGVGPLHVDARRRQEAERDVVAATVRHVAVDRLVADVEPAPWQSVEGGACRVPREVGSGRVVVAHDGARRAPRAQRRHPVGTGRHHSPPVPQDPCRGSAGQGAARGTRVRSRPASPRQDGTLGRASRPASILDLATPGVLASALADPVRRSRIRCSAHASRLRNRREASRSPRPVRGAGARRGTTRWRGSSRDRGTAYPPDARRPRTRADGPSTHDRRR